MFVKFLESSHQERKLLNCVNHISVTHYITQLRKVSKCISIDKYWMTRVEGAVQLENDKNENNPITR